MKTIEERATEWSSQYIGKSRRDITCIAYDRGANDQRSIDIEKACEWIKNYVVFYVKDDNVFHFGECITDFRNAMTE